MLHPAGAALAFAAALLCAAACQRFPKGGIEGTVRDHFGAPIANVHVGVVGLAHSGPSDASGWYRLARVPVGTHRLHATAVGYVPLVRDSVVVRKGVTTRVDFTLDRMWPGLGLPSTPGPGRATILAAPCSSCIGAAPRVPARGRRSASAGRTPHAISVLGVLRMRLPAVRAEALADKPL